MVVPRRFAYLEPINMSLFGKRAFIDVLKMRFCWIRVGPGFNGKCSYKDEQRYRRDAGEDTGEKAV